MKVIIFFISVVAYMGFRSYNLKKQKYMKSEISCLWHNYEAEPKKTNNNILNKPLYTLIWNNCKDCQELIKQMEQLGLKFVYINGNVYFEQLGRYKEDFDTPLLFKEEDFIGYSMFDIYNEIFIDHL